jgi:flagellar M-ring protein FliF
MNAETFTAPLDGFSRLPVAKQIALLVGLALSIALGISIALWSKDPSYAPLYSRMSDMDVSEVAGALNGMGIKYKLDPATGSILVPSDDLYNARLKLASQGLPKVADTGFELLEKDQGLGISRMKEMAIHQRALEGELSRSIASLQSIKSARVHLALPKQSVFVRNRSNASASVVLDLYGGRVLSESQLSGIVHLVSASVPNLEPEHVTVVDQRGKLLTAGNGETDYGLGDKQLDFTRQVENAYMRRVLDIVTPLVGVDGVRTQVVADLDFTVMEETAEVYNPNNTALRSEQVSENVRRGTGPEGVPGALTNQPPDAGTLDALSEEGSTKPLNRSSSATRNFEVDRTIRHVRQVPGALRKLSVAVVVDYKDSVDNAGNVTRVPLSEEELARLTSLVRDAVGYDEARGDTVNVINASFLKIEEQDMDLPASPIWENPLLWNLGKIVLGILGVLLLIFGVLRPTMKGLSTEPARLAAAGEGMAALPPGEGGTGALPGGEDQLSLTHQGPGQYEQKLDQAREIAKEDPKQVAQIVKTWLAVDE